MVQPLQQFIKEDLKEFKDSKKTFDKMMDKYDMAVSRFCSGSRTKDISNMPKIDVNPFFLSMP